MNAREGEAIRALVVDDEVKVASMVGRWLEREGIVVETANSYLKAIEVAERFPCDLVFSDINMPDGSGLDLARWLKERDATIQVVMITGNTHVEPAIEALRVHADDYLVKPLDGAALRHAARRAAEHRRLLLENRAHRQNLEARVQEQARRLERQYVAGVRSLVRALEAKDAHTRGHSDRVAEFAAALAHQVGGLDPELVRRGAQLHDIGKIGIRSEVLRKQGELTTPEADHVRTHPVIGEQILRPLLEAGVILDIVRHHHERWDGRGYPDHLVATEIPLAARIVAVADAYDAMTTARPYRPPRTAEQAIAEIEAEAGRQFDPEVARAAAAAFLGRVELAS